MTLEAYSKKRFLIVDELDTFCFSTKKTLKELGLKLVDTANSAQKVIRGFENINYDVVLCNYDLGKGKNGQELLEELRYRKLLSFSGLFFIISAEVEKGKVMGTVENEPDGYLVKPVSPKDLKLRLEKLLQMKESMQSIDQNIDDGNFEAAIKLCDQKIIEKDNYSLRCLKTKAWLLGKTGDYDQAKVTYQSILKSNDFIWAEYGLAKIALKQESYQEAETQLRHIISKDETQVEAMDLLAEMYKNQNKIEQAQDLVKQAISLSPNALLRQKELADLCVMNNQPDEANEAFQQVQKLSDQSIYAKPEQTYDYVDFLASQATSKDSPIDSNEVKIALEQLAIAEKRFNNTNNITIQTKLMSANLYAVVGDTEEAKKLVEQALNTDSTPSELDAATLKVAASSLSLLGDDQKAEQYLEKAADIASDDPGLVGKIYQQLNNKITLEQRVLATQKNKQGIEYYSEGKTLEATSVLREAQTLTPRHISLNLNLIQVLLKLHKETNDETLLDEVKTLLLKIRHTPKYHKEFKRFAFMKKQFTNRNDI